MGYFAPGVNGSNVVFKVQVENANVRGVNPGGDWTYVSGPDSAGRQSGFQGAGYYVYGSTTSEDYDRTPVSASFLSYGIVVPQGQAGVYTLRLRAAKDPGTPNDAQNDVWVRIDDNAEPLLVNRTDAVSSSGFIKLFANPLRADWQYANQIDSVAEDRPNFTASFNLSAGAHVVTIAGRAEGMHLDFFELYKGSAPSLTAANSTWVPDGEPTSTDPVVNDPIGNVTLAGGAGGSIVLPTNTFTDADGDALTLSSVIPAGLQGSVSFNASARTFTVGTAAPSGAYNITVTARDDDNNAVSDTFQLTIGQPAAAPDIAFRLLGANGFQDASLANGDSYTLAQTGATPTFSGEFGSGSAGSVRIQVLDAAGAVIGGRIENVTPYDYTYNGPALAAGDYTLRAIAYSGANAAGSVLVTDEFDFSITSGSTGGGVPVPGTARRAIASSADDFEIIGAAASTDLEFGSQKGRANPVGLRFTGFDIPETAEIESAYFVFKAEANSTGAANLTIQIENSLAASGYSAGNTPNGRSYLTDTVAWSNIGAWTRDQTYQSADVSGLIEDLLEGGTLDAQDALGFRVTGTGLREAYAFNASAANAPQLVINYVDDFV